MQKAVNDPFVTQFPKDQDSKPFGRRQEANEPADSTSGEITNKQLSSS